MVAYCVGEGSASFDTKQLLFVPGDGNFSPAPNNECRCGRYCLAAAAVPQRALGGTIAAAGCWHLCCSQATLIVTAVSTQHGLSKSTRGRLRTLQVRGR